MLRLFRNPVLLLVFAAWLASRCFAMAHFVPHNDEIINTQIAMFMADDWEANRYFTLDGRMNRGYKEPLQFWLSSTVLGGGVDPLIGVRSWALALAFCGLLFTVLWVDRVWNETAAIFTAAMIVLSESRLYFDTVALNEGFLFGLGAAYLYFLFEFLDRGRWVAGCVATLALAGALLTKTSGQLWIAAGIALPLLVAARRIAPGLGLGAQLRSRGLGWFSRVGATVAGAAILRAFLLPGHYGVIREASVQDRLVRTPAELAELPVDAWLANWNFYWEEVLRVEFSWGAWPLLLLVVLTPPWLFLRHRDHFFRYLILLGFAGLSFVPLVLVSERPFVRYFATGFHLVLIPVAISVSCVWENAIRSWRAPLAIALLLGALGWKLAATYTPLYRWGQTELALRESPEGWANGAGIPELLEKVAALPSGVLIADPGWGHPGTALLVFAQRYPQLHIEHGGLGILRDLEKASVIHREAARPLYVVLDTRVPGERPWADAVLADPRFCSDRTEIKKRYGGRVIANTKLVICYAVPEAPVGLPLGNERS